MALDPSLQALLQGKNFATLTTIGPDGYPSTHVMWVDTDGERVLMNTEVHRQKFKNVSRDTRVAVTVWDAENPYHYGEVRGDVVEVIRGTEARDHIDHVARKYTGGDYANEVVSERAILVIEPRSARVAP